jgi:hypothetical protein
MEIPQTVATTIVLTMSRLFFMAGLRRVVLGDHPNMSLVWPNDWPIADDEITGWRRTRRLTNGCPSLRPPSIGELRFSAVYRFAPRRDPRSS